MLWFWVDKIDNMGDDENAMIPRHEILIDFRTWGSQLWVHVIKWNQGARECDSHLHCYFHDILLPSTGPCFALLQGYVSNLETFPLDLLSGCHVAPQYSLFVVSKAG